MTDPHTVHAAALSAARAFEDEPPRGEVVPAHAYWLAISALARIIERHAPWCPDGADAARCAHCEARAWPCENFLDARAALEAT